ncbi:MAG: ABC transporter substrate-binding protein [Bermanella sp.]
MARMTPILRCLSVLSLLLALVMPAQAQTADPQVLVKAVSDKVLSTILANKEQVKTGPTFLANLIESQIIPIIDQPRMAKYALGKHWKTISDQQKADFTTGFKRLLIKTYSGAFKAYTGQDVTYSATKFNKKKDKAIVTSDIHLAGGSPIRLKYRLYLSKQGGWLVYDANIAGLGLLKTYRAQFSEQIQSDGIENTIAKLNAVQL